MTRARRLLIIVIAAFGAIAAAMLIALAIVTLVVDPNRFRGEIERRVSAAAGVPFRLQGDISIAWFPWLALSTQAASLGASDRPIIAWQGAQIGAKLVPLLRGELVIDRIRLDRPVIRLHRASDGRANWQALRGAAASSAPLPRSAATRSAASSTLDRVAIAGIEIRDGTLDYVDDVTGSRYHLDAWNLDTGALHAEAGLAHIDVDALHLHGNVTGLVDTAIPVRFDAPKLAVILKPAFRVDANAWTATIAGLRLAGSLTWRSDAIGAGHIEASSDELRAVLRSLDIAATPRKDASALGRFRAAADWKLDAGALTLAPLTLELDDTHMRGTVVSLPGASREWRFDLDGDAIDLDRYGESPDVKGEPFELPVATLKALRANGELRLRQARAAGTELQGVRLRVESGAAAR